MVEHLNESKSKDNMDRRNFLSIGVMASSLVAAYGFFAGVVLRFLYPRGRNVTLRPMFVAFADKIPAGESHSFSTPRGEQVILTNTGQLKAGQGHSFTAFSSRCPHLGCKVHYDGEGQQFICPCHQGLFDRKGVAISGPPAQAKQRLSEYPVELNGNSVYVLVEVA